VVGAFLLAFTVASVGMAQAQQPPRREPLLTPEDRAAMGQIFWHRIQEKLGLSDQQAADIRTLLQDQRNAARTDFRAMRTARQQLQTLLAQPNPDPGAIQVAAGQVKGLQAKLFDQRLQTQLALRAKLTPEQWQRWNELRGHGPGRGWTHRGRGFGMGKS
jgi:Spy/CpxP family protein refolding chaperone